MANSMKINEAISIKEVLNPVAPELPMVTPAVPELPMVKTTDVVKSSDSVTLAPTEMTPSAWRIESDGDNIIATCGKHTYRGSTKDFSEMLRSGKYNR